MKKPNLKLKLIIISLTMLSLGLLLIVPAHAIIDGNKNTAQDVSVYKGTSVSDKFFRQSL